MAESNLKNEMSKWDKLSVSASITSALVAVIAVCFSIAHYNATEHQRVIDKRASNRQVFLATLEEIAQSNAVFQELAVVYDDSIALGDLQQGVKSKSHMLLLRAESLLDEQAKDGQVTPPEYFILASEAARHGYYSRAEEYASFALKAKDPNVRAWTSMLLGFMQYTKGNIDSGRDKFREAIRVYEEAESDIIAEDQNAGKVQVCITWLNSEISCGDKSFIDAKRILDQGLEFLDLVRDGPLKASGARAFDRIEALMATKDPPGELTESNNELE